MNSLLSYFFGSVLWYESGSQFVLLELITTKLWLSLTGGGGPIMGDLWALKGLIDEG